MEVADRKLDVTYDHVTWRKEAGNLSFAQVQNESPGNLG